MKIIFCVFLSLVMILGCMSGCANTPSENTTVLSTNSTEMPTTPTEPAEPELSEEEKAAKAKAEVLSAEAQAIYDSYKDCPVYWCGEDSADTLAEGQKAIWVQELPDKSPNSKIRAIYIYYPCAFDPSTMDDNALKENGALRVFGYIGIPNTDGKTLPGMIYVHGAGGHASASCVEEMMNRGFAGISLDTEGYSNITGPNNFSNIESSFRVDPLGHKSKDNYDCEQEPLQNQWMYWAVGDTILANTVMHSLECLDSVSLIGISYGGVVSLTVTCFDQRYDCVVPIYASFGWEYHVGFDEQNVAEKPVARYLWQNREMLAESTVPTLIYCSDDDLFFSVNCNVLTYETLQNGKIIIKDKFNHSQQHGISAPETYRYVTDILGLTEGFIEPDHAPTAEDGYEYTLKLDIPSDMTEPEVKLYYMTYAIRKYQNAQRMPVWKSVDLPYDPETNTVTVSVPQDAYMYYLSFNGKNEDAAAARLHSPYGGYCDYHPAAIYSSTSIVLLKGDTIQYLYEK